MISLSLMWGRIQSNLFPFLEEESGLITEKQQKLVSILKIIRIEESIIYTYKTGRPPSDRKAIVRAFVVKAVYNCSTIRELLDRLKSDKALRRICGWESWNQIPDESTFSRAFAEFAESRLPEEVHEALIKKHMSENLVGHISRDSTEITAREKPVAREKTKKKKSKRKRGRPKQTI